MYVQQKDILNILNANPGKTIEENSDHRDRHNLV